MTLSPLLLAQLAHVAICDADALLDPEHRDDRSLLCEPRGIPTEADVAESERLRRIADRLLDRARAGGLKNPCMDVVFGGAP